jgi:hypothetical protein
MIGRVLSHYRIVGQLGAGGMGVVYSAEDIRLGRQVALKFVSNDLAHDEQAILRLRSEARATSALNHPHICTIYDIGEDNGRPFIVMELMKGQSLRERLTGAPLKAAQVIDLGVEIADALHAAHTEGIVHRDIKPGNVFLTERGHVKILDFGLAKQTPGLSSVTTTDPSPHTSATGVTHGTPAYMSPEQATGETLDGRSDLFSLGVVLYECATGQHPFPGKTSAVVLAGILDRTPASPLALNGELPPRLAEVIGNCLEKDRELRYQSAADLRADLKRLRRDLDSGGVRPIERSGTRSTAVRVEPPSAERAATRLDGAASATEPIALVGPRSRSHRGLWLAAAGLMAVVALAAAVFWPRGGTGPTPAPDAPREPIATPPPAVSTESQMTLAAARLKAGNYRSALTSAREVLALNPAHVEAAKIRDEATAMLARFDTALASARRSLAAGNFGEAARALETARAIDPASPSLVEVSAGLAAAARERDASARQSSPRPAPPNASVPPPVVQQAPPVTAAPPPPPAPLPVPEAAPVPAARPQQPPPRFESPLPPVKEVPPPPVERPALPAPPGPDAEDAAIRRVIATYGRAIEGKDMALFRSIKPNLSAQEERRVQEGFRNVASQRVSLSIVSIDRKENAASVAVRRRDDVEAGGRKQTTETRQVLTLSRTPGGWVIVEIR